MYYFVPLGPFWYHTTAYHMFSLSVSLLPSYLEMSHVSGSQSIADYSGQACGCWYQPYFFPASHPRNVSQGGLAGRQESQTDRLSCMPGYQPLQSNQAYTDHFNNATAATATVRDRVLFIGHSVTKKQVCRENYQYVVSLPPVLQKSPAVCGVRAADSTGCAFPMRLPSSGFLAWICTRPLCRGGRR